MVVLNGDEPTRIPFTTDSRSTSPDVAFASPDLSLRFDWKVFNELSSDHMPVIVSLELFTAIQAKPKHTFLNYGKADWASFTSQVEDGLSSFSVHSFPNVDSAADELTRVIRSASARSVPTGHVRRYNPSFTPEIRQLMRDRTRLRSQLPAPNFAERVREITAEIDRRVQDHTSKIWKEILDSVNYRTNPSKLWKLVRGLNNRNSGIPAGHEALLAPGSTLIPSPRGQANSLIQHYAAISRLPHRPEDRIIKRSLHRISVDPDFCPFSPELVRGAIAKAGGSKARGVDGVSYPHLKHLGTKALDALTALYNDGLSVAIASLPGGRWLRKVIPILKPGKDPTIPSSYRPISLLCNSAKILERLVLNEISPHIRLSTTQHGFRPQHSTTTLLCSLSQSVLEGFNNRKPATRSLIAAIDISKAFDTVPRYILIAKILQSEMPPNLKKWLANFISGRQASVSWGGTKSKTRMFPNGVPQGAVLSPTLFNIFMADLPTPTHPAVSIASYADDLTIVSQHYKVDVAAENLQGYIHQLEDWLTLNRMEVSAQKSSITLLTPHTGEFRQEPVITLGGAVVPVNPTTKVLGVTVDRGMTFRPHTRDVNARAKPRLNVMKALSSTTFGHQKEAQAQLFKAIHQAGAGVCRPGLVLRLGPHPHARTPTHSKRSPPHRDGLRPINPNSPPACGDLGAPPQGAHRYAGGTVLRWSLQRGTPLLPPPRPHSH